MIDTCDTLRIPLQRQIIQIFTKTFPNFFRFNLLPFNDVSQFRYLLSIRPTKTVLTLLRNVRNPLPLGVRTNCYEYLQTVEVQRRKNIMNVSSNAASLYSQRFTSYKTGIITAPNEVWGKAMFSEACVILSD